jgi:SulP family sulfate permease
MPVLVGIMIMVSIGTFDWSSFKYLKTAPKSDAAVMLVTVIIVVATHDLSKGVIAGVILSAILFVAKISTLKVKQQQMNANTIFEIDGQLFFASVESFIAAFDLTVGNTNIVIDFSNATIWDDSAVGAIDKIVLKYRENDNTVTIRGLDTASKKLVDQLAIHNKKNAKLSTH